MAVILQIYTQLRYLIEVWILKDIFNIFLVLSDCFIYHTSSTHYKFEELFPFSYVKKM